MSAAVRHIAVVAPPLPGHLNPLQRLGSELAALGHRVTIVHVEGARRFVDGDGIGFSPIGNADGHDPLDGYLSRLARPEGLIGLTGMIRATAAMTGVLLRQAPEVIHGIGAGAILADSAEAAGPLIAARLGLPHVEAVTGLPLMRDDGLPPPFTGWRYRTGSLARFRNRAGYAVSERLMRPVRNVEARYRLRWQLDRIQEPLLRIAQCPRGLDFPRAGLPPTFSYGSPWRGGAEPAFRPPRDERPLVFCSLGTLQGSRASLFAKMAAACAMIGCRAVIGHAGGLSAEEVGRLPGDPLVRAFWPQTEILRHCSAAVLHGGFNTVLDALAATVPIVALPIAFEQSATAARLVRIGAGLSLSPRRLRATSLAAAIDAVIRDPSYRLAAGRVAAQMSPTGGGRRAAGLMSSALREYDEALRK